MMRRSNSVCSYRDYEPREGGSLPRLIGTIWGILKPIRGLIGGITLLKIDMEVERGLLQGYSPLVWDPLRA